MSFIDNRLKPLFPNSEFTIDEQGIIKVEVTVDNLITVLTRLHSELTFESLQTISCADWLEDEVLHINYILYSYTHNQTIFVAVKLPRELKDDGSKRTVATIPSVHSIWPQANPFERELWEMFGVSITGHLNLKELFLEDWQDIPPLRRDFDTLKFVNDNFEFRPGREDALKVSVERKKVRERKAAEKAAKEGSDE